MKRTRDLRSTRRQFVAGASAGAVVLLTPRLARALPGLAGRNAADPLRPQFHLLPAAHWMNDPNAPIFWKGSYHLFFQYNPAASVWGPMHWDHAVSPDMVHWRHLPVALAPTPGSPDADGCFSGSAIADGGRAVVFYTGVVHASFADATLRDGNNNYRETQCMAVSSSPDLTVWKKDPTPVIPHPPEGMMVTGFRDPSVWREGDGWYMIVGSGVAGVGGCILLYRSRDLKDWEYLHPLASGKKNDSKAVNPVDTGEMWECPDLFPLGGKHVLIYSTEGKVLWQSGVLDKATMLFHAEQNGILDHGAFYAPKTQADAHGNRILWGWIPERRPEAEYRLAGWAGMMSLPRTLGLDDSGRLTIVPSAPVAALRRLLPAMQARQLVLRSANGELLLNAEELTGPLDVTLTLLRNGEPDGAPVLNLRYEPGTTGKPRVLSLDGVAMPLHALDPRRLSVRMLVDGSVIETFINEAEAYTSRFYYPGSVCPDIAVRVTGGNQARQQITLWKMEPISRDRLSS